MSLQRELGDAALMGGALKPGTADLHGCLLSKKAPPLAGILGGRVAQKMSPAAPRLSEIVNLSVRRRSRRDLRAPPAAEPSFVIGASARAHALSHSMAHPSHVPRGAAPPSAPVPPGNRRFKPTTCRAIQKFC